MLSIGPILQLRPLTAVEAGEIKRALAEGGPRVMPHRGGAERSATKDAARTEFGIEVAGRVIGLVQTYAPPDRELPSGTVEIGIGISRPSMRGQGIGTQALRLFVDWLKQHEAVRSVQAVTALDNTGMRIVLERLGFVPRVQVVVGDLIETLFVLDLRSDARTT